MAEESFQERTRRLTRERTARHRARRRVEGERVASELARTVREGGMVHRVDMPAVVHTVHPGHVTVLAGHHPGCKCLLCTAARG